MAVSKTHELVKDFKKRYGATLNWYRTKAHAKLVDKNLGSGEEVIYAFAAQIQEPHGTMFNTAVLALTNKRIIVAQNRLIVGYKVISITPTLYNDITIDGKYFWGSVKIDTVKEVVTLICVSRKALPEIQKIISKYMKEMKQATFNPEGVQERNQNLYDKNENS